MKIAFYSPMKPIDHSTPSGDRLIARHLCQYLREKGHEVFILSRLRTLFLHQKPIRYIFFWWPLYFITSLINVLKEKPDIFFSYHVTGNSPDLLAPFICRIMGMPYYIFDGNYSVTHRDNLSTWLGDYTARYAFHRARHIFVNKEKNYTSFLEKLGQDRVSYIKPGVLLNDFKDYSPSTIRGRYQIKENIPVISSTSMCRPGRKAESIRFLIDCLERLKIKSIKFVWIHAGGDGEFESLKEYAKNKLGDAAIMPGTMETNEIHALMQASDVFAFPGINETLGMVYLEAQYYQTPVVAFDNGGINEVVKNNITGLLVPPMDIDVYTNAIEILLSDQQKRSKMGRNAQKSVISDHDIKKNYQIILDMLKA